MAGLQAFKSSAPDTDLRADNGTNPIGLRVLNVGKVCGSAPLPSASHGPGEVADAGKGMFVCTLARCGVLMHI